MKTIHLSLILAWLLFGLSPNLKAVETLRLLTLEEDLEYRSKQVQSFETRVINGEAFSSDISDEQLNNPVFRYIKGVLLIKEGCVEHAERLLRESAASGVTAAKIHMGDSIVNGTINGQISEAKKYYIQASEAGSELALLRLASLMLNSEGAIEDAIKIYEKLSKKGNAESFFNLGVIQETLKNDIFQAVYYYEEAAKLGIVDAMYNLFVIYSRQDFKAYDSDKSYQYLINAAEKGHVEAQYFLSMGLIEKSQNEDAVKEGISLMTASAKSGYVPAMAYLGQFYSERIDSEESYLQAETWLVKASNGGDETSRYNLLQFYEAFTGIAPNAEEKANELRQKSGVKE